MNSSSRKLLLRNYLSPGDIVMLTAAIRDLHAIYPGKYLTAVETTAEALWQHNPHVTTQKSFDRTNAEVIDCEYPLIHRSNQTPFHFIHGFQQFLSKRIGVNFTPTAFKGDIYLSDDEKSWISQVQEITGGDHPYWIVVAGGKHDYTIKWWSHPRFQEVVNHFQGKIQFVQIGEDNHHHLPLENVIDLRGKTDIRQLVRLMYHAQGVLCPVTFAMHLAPAVPTKPGEPKSRPCVVVAGGREPVHWEAYPGHRFLHTQGALSCCELGGCWKARTVQLGDGSQNDRRENLCVRVTDAGLPRCMDMITTGDVIRAVESYFEGDLMRYLDRSEARILAGGSSIVVDGNSDKKTVLFEKPEKFQSVTFATTAPSFQSPPLHGELIEVCGLRRSGLHSVINWVASHYKGNVSFVNDINHRRKTLLEIESSDRLPCIDEKLRIPVAPIGRNGDLHLKRELLLLGYEDASVEEVIDSSSTDEIASLYEKRLKIAVIRDPFNLAASRMQAAKNRIESQFSTALLVPDQEGRPLFLSHWKDYAREFLGLTDQLGGGLIPINYNRWVTDLNYRRELSERLGRPFCDTYRESVPAYGNGSSFDGLKLDQNASNMAVFDRWRAFQDDPEFLSWFDDRDLLRLARQIFGESEPLETLSGKNIAA